MPDFFVSLPRVAQALFATLFTWAVTAAGAAVGSELSAFVPPQPARDSTSRAHSSMVIVFFILVLSS